MHIGRSNGRSAVAVARLSPWSVGSVSKPKRPTVVRCLQDATILQPGLSHSLRGLAPFGASPMGRRRAREDHPPAYVRVRFVKRSNPRRWEQNACAGPQSATPRAAR